MVELNGTWKRVLQKRAVRITIRPFAPLSAAAKSGVDAAIARYRQFLDVTDAFSVVEPPVSNVENRSKGASRAG